MTRRCGIALLLLASALAVGCTTRTRNIAYSPPSFGSPDVLPIPAAAAQRRLVPGDVVTIRVFELDSLTGDQTVGGAGAITLPLIGVLPADGKTLEQLRDDITRALLGRYLQSPHVLVTLKEAAQTTLTVDGAVRQPGVYAIEPTATLVQTLAMAKGPSADANLKRVVIFRRVDGVRQAAAFDITTIRKGKDPDPRVYPNDVIVVDGSAVSGTYQLLLRSLPLAAFFTRF